MPSRTLITTGTVLAVLVGCGSPDPLKSDDDFLHEVRLSDTADPTGGETGIERPIETGDPPDTGDDVPAVDMDGDGFSPSSGDCDDTDPDIHPDAAEVCDEIDNDCDGEVDNAAEDGRYWYVDEDGDGYGLPLGSVWTCEAPEGTAPVLGDCDDADSSIRPGAPEWCDGVDNDCNGLIDETGAVGSAPWWHDADRDGYGDPLDLVYSCNPLLGYAENDGDCDDADPTVHPGATETCNGSDDDCDGTVDDGFDMYTYYADTDGDLRGDPLAPLVSCVPPAGYVDDTSDCDDTDDEVHADMPELCDEKDNDCNGLVDDEVATYWFYRDLDSDGVGDASDSIEACDRPDGYVIDLGDCDDADDTVYPGAWETCNGVDDDCSGVIDDGLTFSTFYRDLDNDGYGDLGSTIEACAVPVGYVVDSTDCDDSDLDVHPGIEADCADGVDEDCDGEIDEGPDRTWFADADGDGYGDPTSSVTTCLVPEGYVADATDCNDEDATVFPEAREICDDLADGDCDGLLDEEDPDCDCPDHGIVFDEDMGSETGIEVRTGSTVGMGDDIDGSCGSSGGQDYVLFWEAPADGCYELTTNGSSFDTLLLIYHGCEGTEIACNDDGGEGLRSRLTLSSVEEGDVFFLVIDGYSSFSTGNFVLNINDC